MRTNHITGEGTIAYSLLDLDGDAPYSAKSNYLLGFTDSY